MGRTDGVGPHALKGMKIHRPLPKLANFRHEPNFQRVSSDHGWYCNSHIQAHIQAQQLFTVVQWLALHAFSNYSVFY